MPAPSIPQSNILQGLEETQAHLALGRSKICPELLLFLLFNQEKAKAFYLCFEVVQSWKVW